MNKTGSNPSSSSKCSSKPRLPKINNTTNNKNNKNNLKKGRSNTMSDFHSSAVTSTSNSINNSKRQSSSTSLPSVTKSGSCLQHNGRLRSKTEIITSSVSYIGYSSCAGYGDKRRAPVSLKKRLSSAGALSPQRRWSTISEESSCSTRLKLSLKVPSSPQFQQVLQEIGN